MYPKNNGGVPESSVETKASERKIKLDHMDRHQKKIKQSVLTETRLHFISVPLAEVWFRQFSSILFILLSHLPNAA
jgi:hypothetical protein